jgi:flavin-binding protein dodecin
LNPIISPGTNPNIAAIGRPDVVVPKIVEIVGSSDKGWEDAAQVAVEEAMKTLRGIRGIEVTDQTAQVDPKTGKIIRYRTCIKLSFGLESK